MLLGLAHTLCPISHSFGTVPNYHTKKMHIIQDNSSRPIAFSFTRGISSTPWGFVCVERNQWYSTFISKLYFYCRRSCGVQKFFTLSYDLLRRGQQCSVQHIKKIGGQNRARQQWLVQHFHKSEVLISRKGWHKWSQSICFSQAMFVPRKGRLHTCKNAVETNLIKTLGRQTRPLMSAQDPHTHVQIHTHRKQLG